MKIYLKANNRAQLQTFIDACLDLGRAFHIAPAEKGAWVLSYEKKRGDQLPAASLTPVTPFAFCAQCGTAYPLIEGNDQGNHCGC